MFRISEDILISFFEPLVELQFLSDDPIIGSRLTIEFLYMSSIFFVSTIVFDESNQLPPVLVFVQKSFVANNDQQKFGSGTGNIEVGNFSASF